MNEVEWSTLINYKWLLEIIIIRDSIALLVVSSYPKEPGNVCSVPGTDPLTVWGNTFTTLGVVHVWRERGREGGRGEREREREREMGGWTEEKA